MTAAGTAAQARAVRVASCDGRAKSRHMKNRRRPAVIAIVLGVASGASGGCTPSSTCNVAGTCADCSFRGVCRADGFCVCEDGWGGGDNYGCSGATCVIAPAQRFRQDSDMCKTEAECTAAGGTWTGTTANSLSCNFCAPTVALLDPRRVLAGVSKS